MLPAIDLRRRRTMCDRTYLAEKALDARARRAAHRGGLDYDAKRPYDHPIASSVRLAIEPPVVLEPGAIFAPGFYYRFAARSLNSRRCLCPAASSLPITSAKRIAPCFTSAQEDTGEVNTGSACKTLRLQDQRDRSKRLDCPLLAQSGHRLLRCKCLLLGVKRTWLFALHMSAYDPKRTSM